MMRIVGMVLAMLLTSPMAFGVVIENTASNTGLNSVGVSAGFSFGEVEYEGEEDENTRTERKIFGVGSSFGVSDDAAIFVQVGRISDAEIQGDEGSRVDFKNGEGYIMGMGVKGVLSEGEGPRIMGYTAINYMNEEWDEEIDATEAGVDGANTGEDVDIAAEATVMDIHTGVLAVFTGSQRFQPYAGLDLVVMSDGEAEVTTKFRGESNTNDGDFERNDIFNLKLGANIALSDAGVIRPEATLLGERSFLVTGAFAF